MRASTLATSVAAGLACLGVVALGWSGPPNARPRYGGIVRIEVPGVIRALDLASESADPAESATRATVLPLVFETLVRVDAVAGLQPLLAESWQSDAQDRRWQFRLRRRVALHDGNELTPADVATALRTFNAAWTVKEAGDGVQIESAEPMPDLPWALADPRRAIAITRPAGLPVGTGPFRVDRWEPGRRLVLAAHEGYRDGRPFVDGVQIEMGRALRDEVVSLELGRADIVSLLPQDVRRVSDRHLRVATSRPRELVALVFDARRPAASNEQLRTAVALAIDRATICTVLLQRQGEVATALMPDWLSGYASIFSARYDRGAARSIVASLPLARRTVSLQYPASDAIALAVADRVAVDVREVGLTVRIAPSSGTTGPPPDLRLLHLTLDATTPDRALALLVTPLGLDATRLPLPGSPLELASRFEQALLEPNLVVPLVHLPQIYGLSPRLERSNGPIVTPTGALNLADAWLRGGTP